MNTGKMKNMVVLKDLPSNLIDEAIIILKPNIAIKNLNYVKKNENGNNKQEQFEDNSGNYIVNEAEMVIANYISSLESHKDVKGRNIEYKYKILKTCTFLLTSLLIVTAILNFFKI